MYVYVCICADVEDACISFFLFIPRQFVEKDGSLISNARWSIPSITSKSLDLSRRSSPFSLIFAYCSLCLCHATEVYVCIYIYMFVVCKCVYVRVCALWKNCIRMLSWYARIIVYIMYVYTISQVRNWYNIIYVYIYIYIYIYNEYIHETHYKKNTFELRSDAQRSGACIRHVFPKALINSGTLNCLIYISLSIFFSLSFSVFLFSLLSMNPSCVRSLVAEVS